MFDDIKNYIATLHEVLLLVRISIKAKACKDIKEVINEIRISPRGSSIVSVWFKRAETLCTQKVDGVLPQIPFSYTRELVWMGIEHGELGKKALMRLLELPLNYVCDKSIEAYILYYRLKSIKKDVSDYFKQMAIDLVRKEASGYKSYPEIRQALLKYLSDWSMGYLRLGSAEPPAEILNVWYLNINQLYEQDARIQAPLCTSIEEAAKKTQRYYGGGVGNKIWNDRLIELADEDAQRNAPECLSLDSALKKYQESPKRTKSQQIWQDKVIELVLREAEITKDRLVVKELYDKVPDVLDVKRKLLIRFMELYLS
ncbi:MAG: hypothetical protein H6779_03350 [Candidatus Nomurabacteria bacterium]|nr:hypothetical protein [Candidatus Nomurabacteria bacterium]USN87424.1 MAG: hypothetical protein H6779_03350 [Candidatus Nomurabacteria bacterium]